MPKISKQEAEDIVSAYYGKAILTIISNVREGSHWTVKSRNVSVMGNNEQEDHVHVNTGRHTHIKS